MLLESKNCIGTELNITIPIQLLNYNLFDNTKTTGAVRFIYTDRLRIGDTLSNVQPQTCSCKYMYYLYSIIYKPIMCCIYMS